MDESGMDGIGMACELKTAYPFVVNNLDDGRQSTRVWPRREEHNAPDLDQLPWRRAQLDVTHRCLIEEVSSLNEFDVVDDGSMLGLMRPP